LTFVNRRIVAQAFRVVNYNFPGRAAGDARGASVFPADDALHSASRFANMV